MLLSTLFKIPGSEIVGLSVSVYITLKDNSELLSKVNEAILHSVQPRKTVLVTLHVHQHLYCVSFLVF